MAKTKMTWRDLVTKIMQDRKKKGEKPSLKDVAPEAQKEWASIKGGTHPLYEQGKATFNKSKKISKAASTKKTRKGKGKGKGKGKSVEEEEEGGGNDTMMDDAAQIISKCKLCKKCSKKVEKVYGAGSTKGGKGKKGGSGGTTANNNVPDSSFKSSEPAAVTNAKITQDLHTVTGGGSSKKGGCGPACGVMGGGGTCAAHAAPAPAAP
jgi:hypothetical protein